MNWTEPRKSQKSSEQAFSASKKIQTTCLNTPLFDRQFKAIRNDQSSIQPPPAKQKNCPYHFNIQDHVCLTCRKSICVRCAITYCQNHAIKQQREIIPVLVQDLQKVYIKEKVDEIEIKLGQSLQRQDYLQSKVAKLIEKIEENFAAVVNVLNKKKLQIISYFDEEFHKYLCQYRQYDELLKKKLLWLNSQQKQCILAFKQQSSLEEKFSIQKIDLLNLQMKEESQILKVQKRLNNMLIGKNKFISDKFWSEQNLQRVLFEIQSISYGFGKQLTIPSVKIIQKKKRIITQSSELPTKQNSSNFKSPALKNIKASGRLLYTKFSSGRKNKEQRLQKSQLK